MNTLLSGLALILMVTCCNGHTKDPAISFVTDVVFPAGDFCTCRRGDVYYTVTSAGVCGSFTRRSGFTEEETVECPPGLQFNLKYCACDYHANNDCPRNCPGEIVSPASTNQRTCKRGENIYAQVPDTGCKSFTQSTATLSPQRHNCPANLLFDLEICNCNTPSSTTCKV